MDHTRKVSGHGNCHGFGDFIWRGELPIEPYTKDKLIFTAYQLKVLWEMVLIPDKLHPYVSDTKNIMYKSVQKKYPPFSKPYSLIIQRVKKPPDYFSPTSYFLQKLSYFLVVYLNIYSPVSNKLI